MKRTSFLFVLLLLGSLWATAQTPDRGFRIVAASPDERRLALVIGNKDYQFANSLKNPVNDAQDVSATLKLLGFSVTTVTNADFRATLAAINRFVADLRPADVVVFYYAGHGIGYNGKNYLLPVDANIRCIEEIDEHGVSLGRLLSVVESRQVRNSFVFLDACRNLPQLRACRQNNRDLETQGLVRPANNPSGSMIVYATREGATADDNGTARNGLFTGELLKHLTTPDLGIRQILDLTKRGVESQSNRRQSPARYDELDGDFVFIRRIPKSEPAKPTTTKYLDLPFADMAYVEGGTFQMGDTRGEGESDEKPVHTVTVSSFLMGKYEVTQRQWESVMGSNPSSSFEYCPDCPVGIVSWDDVQVFIMKLNARTGGHYRLPTEAEWEYAAGGGNTPNRTRFGNGQNVLDPAHAYFDASALGKKPYSVAGENLKDTAKVGSFLPNQLGLYDLSGSGFEWCSDWYGVYNSSTQTDPTGPTSGTYRVFRGGCWTHGPAYCRSTSRLKGAPTVRFVGSGFRIVSTTQ